VFICKGSKGVGKTFVCFTEYVTLSSCTSRNENQDQSGVALCYWTFLVDTQLISNAVVPNMPRRKKVHFVYHVSPLLPLQMKWGVRSSWAISRDRQG
jgi:hypothetical protein